MLPLVILGTKKDRPGYRAVDESSKKKRYFYGTTGRRTNVRQQQQIQILAVRVCIDATIAQGVPNAKYKVTLAALVHAVPVSGSPV